MESNEYGWRHTHRLIRTFSKTNMASENQIQRIKKILTDWNPLGPQADSVNDLDDYDTEAKDIAAASLITNSGRCTPAIIQSVIEDAFDLNLDTRKCREVSERIDLILKTK